MKKAFTLVELIGVLILISVVVLLAIPIIEKELKSGKQKLYDSQITFLQLALKNWATDNPYYLPDKNESLNWCFLITLISSL